MNDKKINLSQLQKDNEKRLNNVGEIKTPDFDIFGNVNIFEELSNSFKEVEKTLEDDSNETIETKNNIKSTTNEREETQEIKLSRSASRAKNSDVYLNLENLEDVDIFSDNIEDFSNLQTSLNTHTDKNENIESSPEEVEKHYVTFEHNKSAQNLDDEVLNQDSTLEQEENFDMKAKEEVVELNFSNSILPVEDQKVFQINKNEFYTNNNSILIFVYENENLSEFFNLGFKDEDINKKFGKLNKINTLGNENFTNLYFVGLGKEEEFDQSKLPQLFASFINEIDEDINIDFVTWQFENKEQLVFEITKEFIQSKYIVNKVTNEDVAKQVWPKINLALDVDCQAQIDIATINAQSQALAKDLMYLPSNILTPEVFVDFITSTVKDLKNVSLDIKDTKQLIAENYGLITGVNQGSDKNAYLVTLEYNGKTSEEYFKTIIGKGITFDTGGYSLKPVTGMLGMHTDMGGAAISLATFSAIAKLEAKINLRCILVITENLINGQAYKVEDVLVSKSGKTVQIMSTDAEGRLVLADALTHAQQFKTDEAITIATLTASNYLTDFEIVPVFSNSPELTNELIISSNATNDYMWPMPLNHFNEVLTKKVTNSSKIADFANKSTKAGSPMIYGANFIYSFVENKEQLHFAHLDIGGQVTKDGKYTTPTLSALINYYLSLQTDN